MPTGMLSIDINTNISTLDTRRMARQGPGNLLSNATRFLVNDRGLADGDFISVTQGAGTTPSLLFVQDAQRLDGLVLETAGTKKAAKKAAKKSTKKTAKKTKRPAKKSAKKKARKTSKKKSVKSSSKHSKKSGKKSTKKHTR